MKRVALSLVCLLLTACTSAGTFGAQRAEPPPTAEAAPSSAPSTPSTPATNPSKGSQSPDPDWALAYADRRPRRGI